MKASELSSSEYNSYYGTYIALNNGLDLIESLIQSAAETKSFFESLPEDKLNYRYEVGKWTIKEILQHLMDTERVFAYRALCFARQDKTALPGFDQDAYVGPSQANNRPIKELLAEYEALRASSYLLFKGFSDDMFKNIGIASGSPLSVAAAGFIIVGHEKHHCRVIRERYL